MIPLETEAAAGSHESTAKLAVLETLENAFGTSFQLWAKQGNWHAIVCSQPSVSIDTSALTADQISSLLDCHYSDDYPVVTALADGLNLVVVPVDHAGRVPYAAVGIVAGHDTNLLNRLASSTLLTIDQQRQLDDRLVRLDAYAKQVSHDFEELSWLRSLAEHIEYCDATNGVQNVAKTVLPSLCELIGAETLVLIPVESQADAGEFGQSGTDRSLIRMGKTVDDEQICRRLVACFGEQAKTQPFVNNQLSEHPELADVSGLSSCILVPVSKTDNEFGWLLALNKVTPGDSLIDNLQIVHPELSEQEFGTFEAGLLAAAAVMLATHGRNIDLFREKEILLIGVIRALINAIDAKDTYTCGHSDRVALIAKRLAEEHGQNLQYCERIYMTGLLHDIGKIGVPDEVLLKPGKLTDEEFDKIKQHPAIDYSILKHVKQLSYVLPGVLHHHESIDGHGYPNQLTGESIPLSARILAVADAYDAMTSHRPYRSAISFEKAESILQENAGTQWDAQVVETFFCALDDIHTICQKSEIDSEKLIQTNPTASNTSSDPRSDAIVAAVTSTQE
jgi:HD-GYP domain-containing protein (c-di-GMP phosphodiesterase class II)